MLYELLDRLIGRLLKWNWTFKKMVLRFEMPILLAFIPFSSGGIEHATFWCASLTFLNMGLSSIYWKYRERVYNFFDILLHGGS